MRELSRRGAGLADAHAREPEQLQLFDLVDVPLPPLRIGSGAAGASTVFSGDRARQGRERRNTVDAAHLPHAPGTAASAADARARRLLPVSVDVWEVGAPLPPLLAYIAFHAEMHP